MPQPTLPIFQTGDVPINPRLSYRRDGGTIWYFNWAMPVFHHAEDDLESFRMITAEFCVNGGATQAEICRAFGIPAVTMKRAAKRLRDGGTRAFFAPRKTRGASVLTPEVLAQTQAMLDAGQTRSEIAAAMTIKPDTLYKAVVSGRLHEQALKKSAS